MADIDRLPTGVAVRGYNAATKIIDTLSDYAAKAARGEVTPGEELADELALIVAAEIILERDRCRNLARNAVLKMSERDRVSGDLLDDAISNAIGPTEKPRSTPECG